MDTIEAILTRRSIRSLNADRSIPECLLAEIVECGHRAPSSKNARPWELHLITDRALLETIAADVMRQPDKEEYVPCDPATGRPRPQFVSTVAESAKLLSTSPAAVFIENRGVFSGGRANIAAHPDTVRASLIGYGLEMVGLGAVVQNLLLAAHANHLGATFMGDVLIAERDIRSRLGFAGDLVGVVTLGFGETA